MFWSTTDRLLVLLRHLPGLDHPWVRRAWRSPSSPLAPLRLLVLNRFLITQLVRREIAGKYRSTALGWIWAVATPLIMLGIYTFVFGIVLEARWKAHGMGDGPDNSLGTPQFALVLFCGLMLHHWLAEIVSRAPGLVLEVPNLVKRVVFPVEVLAWVAVLSAGFAAAASFLVLLVGTVVIEGAVPPTVVLAPLVVLTLLPWALGLAWLLSGLGVLVRDIAQATAPAPLVLLFMSPVFYSADRLPEFLRPWFYLNPLTLPIEQLRAVTLYGQLPDFGLLALYTLVGLLVAWGGHTAFVRLRPAFAEFM